MSKNITKNIVTREIMMNTLLKEFIYKYIFEKHWCMITINQITDTVNLQLTKKSCQKLKYQTKNIENYVKQYHQECC